MQHSSRDNLVGEADARRPIMPVRVMHIPVARSQELQRTHQRPPHQSAEWVQYIRIKDGRGVMAVRVERLNLVANSTVQGQLPRRPPVVLQILADKMIRLERAVRIAGRR